MEVSKDDAVSLPLLLLSVYLIVSLEVVALMYSISSVSNSGSIVEEYPNESGS